ncbi:MAG TPA: hypothetical protein VGH99_10690 [Pseudonocardia sp.]|jgi:hypothetical protein
MRDWERWLSRAAAATLAAATLVPGPAAGGASGPPGTDDGPHHSTASHYLVLPGDPAAADALGYRSGCADGHDGVTGLRVLFFGTQEAGGRIRPPGTSAASPAVRFDRDGVRRAAEGWMRGFTLCGSANAVLALGVNNKADGKAVPAPAGADWAALVEQVAKAAPLDRVAVTGALDGEPSWSPPAWARSWVDGYVHATHRLLYAANSADGCPQAEVGEACSNGWTVRDVFHVSTGAASTVVAIPQIYRTDGVQARQWASISRWGARTGAGPLRVVGALSQHAACHQSTAGCPRTDNTPEDARTQLTEALAGEDAGHGAERGRFALVSSDMDWVPGPLDPR